MDKKHLGGTIYFAVDGKFELKYRKGKRGKEKEEDLVQFMVIREMYIRE